MCPKVPQTFCINLKKSRNKNLFLFIICLFLIGINKAIATTLKNTNSPVFNDLGIDDISDIGLLLENSKKLNCKIKSTFDNSKNDGDASPMHPYILSEIFIKKEFLSRLQSLSPIIQTAVKTHQSLDNFSSAELVKYQESICDLRKLGRLSIRYLEVYKNRESVRFSRKYNDLQPFFKARAEQDQITKELLNWNNVDTDRKKQIYSLFLEVYRLKNPWLQEYDESNIAQIGSKELSTKFRTIIDELEKQIREENFEISKIKKSSLLRFSINKTSIDATLVIHVPVKVPSESIADLLTNSIAKAWSGSLPGNKRKIKVEFDILTDSSNQNGATLEISFAAGQIPYALFNSSLIVLDPNEINQEIALTHEFGHILGFPDCYRGFWDERISSVVYYSIDPKNVMCSISGRVLPNHLVNLWDRHIQELE